MPDQFEQYYKYLKANGADVAPDFNSFKNTLSDYNNASKYYSYLKENKFDVPDTYDSFANTFGLKKKAANLQSSAIPSRLPKEPDFLQQGQKVASGEIFTDISKSVPKTTLKEAAIKDKNNNNSYLGAMWNNVVASAERLAGGATRLAQKFDTSPVSRIQEAVDKAASSVTGVNYEALREKEIADKVKSFIGKARTSASSKEYEQGLAQGFDITNGIGLDDLKGLGAVLPSMLADIAIAAPTGGSTFAIQGYDDALSIIDNTPEAKNISETTRTAFGFGGAIIAGVLEKIGMNSILKSGTATKYVTAKILKEAAEELAKKGVKVTAEQFEKSVANKATQMLTRTALKNTVKAGAKSTFVEGATEATQEGAMDLMKLAANQLESKKIFDEEELKNTAASRYLNAAAMGGILGGGLGGGLNYISSRAKNVQQHIENEVKNAKTQEDIAAIINDINENLKDGTISENDAEVFKSMVDENISKPVSLEIENEKETKLSEVNEKINSLNKEDRLYNDNLNKLNKERDEIVSYYDNLLKESQKDEATSFDDGKAPIKEEIITEEVTPIGVKIGDAVQWTSQGTDQFAEPRKIKSISEDGEYAFVEGSNTGIPVKELSVIEEVKPNEVNLTSPKKMNASQNRYGIVKDGGEAGFIVATNPENNVVRIKGVTVNEELRGKNIAGDAYVKLGESLAKEGISLESDSFDKMEPSATRVWEKLADKGLAVKGKNSYEFKPTEVKPKKEKTTARLLSSEEPPEKGGQTIVTLSGKTEAERLASISQRQKDTKVSDKVVSDNEIVQDAESYFKKSGNYKNSADGRAELNNLRIRARENGLTIDTERNAVTKPNKAGRPTKVRYNNKADGEAVIEPNAKTLRDRSRDVQEAFEELTDSAVFLDVESESGKRMSATQIEAAIKDINEGIPSKRANKYLDVLEKSIEEDAFPLYDKGRGGFAPKLSEIRAELGVEKEVIGEPMDEAALNKFLSEEAELTPEEEQDLLDNIENLLYEYETTEEGPQREVQPIEARAEERVSRKTEPVAEAKKAGKVPKPVKEAPKETEIAKEYKEAVNKASKKAKENAKKDFVDRNFDNIVEKLKIQIKCPT